MNETRTPAEQETEGWLRYIMGGTDEKPTGSVRLVWTDPQSGSEHPITRVSAVKADGTFRGLFTDSVRGVFRMRDCRTA